MAFKIATAVTALSRFTLLLIACRHRKRLGVVGLTIILSSFASAEAFDIEHYQVDINVAENNVYYITEVIDVVFNSPRHGIERKLPLRFDRDWVKISEVKILGSDFNLSRDQEYLKIRIGSPDRWVEGKVTYEISYIYAVGADRLHDMDEFNHNIIGIDWDTTIAEVDFTIQMPHFFPIEAVNCTSGSLGSTDNTRVSWEVDGNTIRGKTNQPLRANEALTVALPLPEGYWVGAKRNARPASLLFKVLGYPLYVFVAVVSLLIWFMKGRDNKLYPSVEFEPPFGMSPGEIGYVIDGGVESKDVTSYILYWAGQGHLTIDVEGDENGKGAKVMTLTKVSNLKPEAKPFEKTLFKKLFSLGTDGVVTTNDLSYKFHGAINQAVQGIESHFKDNPEHAVYEKSSLRRQALVGFLSMLPVFAALLEVFAPIKGSGPLWLVGVVITAVLYLPTYFAGKILSRQSTFSMGAVAMIFSGLIVGFGLLGYSLVTFVGVSVNQVFTMTLVTWFAGLMVTLVTKRTPYGDELLTKVIGFREFIKSAQKEQIEKSFEQNPSYFYNILPYAIVLGLSKQWSKHFNQMSLAPPPWYRGYRRRLFDRDDFLDHMHSSMSYLNSSMTSAPSSSSGSSGSSSSGGSSGGGSGGGGGSSW